MPDQLLSPPQSPCDYDIVGLADNAYGTCMEQDNSIGSKRPRSTSHFASPKSCLSFGTPCGSKRVRLSSFGLSPISSPDPVSEGCYEEVFTEPHSPGLASQLATPRAFEDDISNVSGFTPVGTTEVVQAFEESHGDDSQLNFIKSDDASAALETLNVSRNVGTAGNNDDCILERYKDQQPSFTFHLYPNFLTINDGNTPYPYAGTGRSLIQHVRRRTIPHELMRQLLTGCPWYEGCLIVRIVFHKREFEMSKELTFQQFAVIKNSEFTTPSSYSLYDIGNIDKPGDSSVLEISNKLVEDAGEFKVFTAVLHPTLKSHEAEMELIRQTLAGSNITLNDSDYRQVLQDIEAALINASAPHLILDAANWSDEAMELLERLSSDTDFDQPSEALNEDSLKKQLQNRKVKEEIDEYMQLWGEGQPNSRSPNTARIVAQQRSLIFHILMLRRQKYCDTQKAVNDVALKSLQKQLSIPQNVSGYLTQPAAIEAAIQAARTASNGDKRGMLPQREGLPGSCLIARPAFSTCGPSRTSINQTDAYIGAAGLAKTQLELLPGNRPLFKLGSCQNANANTATIAPEKLQISSSQDAATVLQEQPQQVELSSALPLKERASMVPVPSGYPAVSGEGPAAPTLPIVPEAPVDPVAPVPTAPTAPGASHQAQSFCPPPAMAPDQFQGMASNSGAVDPPPIWRQPFGDGAFGPMNMMPLGPHQTINNDVQGKAIQSGIARAIGAPAAALVHSGIAAGAIIGQLPQNPIAAMHQGATMAASMAQQAVNQPPPQSIAPVADGIQQAPAVGPIPVPAPGHIAPPVAAAVPAQTVADCPPPIASRPAQPIAPAAPIPLMPTTTENPPIAPLPVTSTSGPRAAAHGNIPIAPQPRMVNTNQRQRNIGKSKTRQKDRPAVVPIQPAIAPSIQPRLDMAHPQRRANDKESFAANHASRQPLIAPALPIPDPNDGKPEPIPSNPIAAQHIAFCHQQRQMMRERALQEFLRQQQLEEQQRLEKYIHQRQAAQPQIAAQARKDSANIQQHEQQSAAPVETAEQMVREHITQFNSDYPAPPNGNISELDWTITSNEQPDWDSYLELNGNP